MWGMLAATVACLGQRRHAVTGGEILEFMLGNARAAAGLSKSEQVEANQSAFHNCRRKDCAGDDNDPHIPKKGGLGGDGFVPHSYPEAHRRIWGNSTGVATYIGKMALEGRPARKGDDRARANPQQGERHPGNPGSLAQLTACLIDGATGRAVG